MKLLYDAFREKLMDIRLRDKLLHEKKITQKQVDDHLKSLEEGSYVEGTEAPMETVDHINGGIHPGISFK